MSFSQGDTSATSKNHTRRNARDFGTLLIHRDFARHRPWIIFVALATIVAVWFYVREAAQSTELPGGGTPIGLIYGTLGAAIILFEMLLWPRKKVRAWRIGSAQGWLRAHIWLGLLCVPVAVLHTGFTLGSPLTTVLMVVFGVVIASGVYGVVAQQIIPRILLDEVPAETIHSQIGHVSERHAWDAEDMILAICGPDPQNRSKFVFPNRRKVAHEATVVKRMRRVGAVRGVVLESRSASGTLNDGRLLRDTFYDVVVEYLLKGRKSGSRLADQTYAARFFADLQAVSEPEAKTAIETLDDLCRQRRQFDLQSKWFFRLHSWLWLHLPLSAALLVLLVVHVFVALKYL